LKVQPGIQVSAVSVDSAERRAEADENQGKEAA
jgi:hypothetical protein